MRRFSRFLSKELRAEPRFGLLFFMLLLGLALPAILPPGTIFHVALQVFMSGILIVGLASVSHGKWLVILGLSLVLPAITLNWLARVVDKDLIVVSNLVAMAFLLYLAVLILNYLLRTTHVDANTIYGALCVFLLLGFIWGFAFFVLEVVDPYSLTDGGAPLYEDIGGMLEAMSDSLYLSFVTLTTLGYGDITPATQPGRTLAILEAIIGQIFLVVMIARFVGLNVAHSIRRAED